MVANGEGIWRGLDLEFGISRWKLISIEWINTVLLYSTKSPIQYPMINHNGKEYEEECVKYMHN